MEWKEIAPAIFVYENVIDNCDNYINRALRDRGSWNQASVGKGDVKEEIRNCDVLEIDSTIKGHVDDIILAKRFFELANHYGNETHVACSDMEPLQLLHYKTGSQYYKPHSDDGALQPRIFSSLLYLNDVEEGGETRFTRFDVSVKPKAGRLVMFPSNYAYEHEALPPISNEKFAVVTWFTPVMIWLAELMK
jgi:predicted 2-oxoglutarate/Fe(II)-dependent dioxygenase YbiX